MSKRRLAARDDFDAQEDVVNSGDRIEGQWKNDEDELWHKGVALDRRDLPNGKYEIFIKYDDGDKEWLTQEHVRKYNGASKKPSSVPKLCQERRSSPKKAPSRSSSIRTTIPESGDDDDDADEADGSNKQPPSEDEDSDDFVQPSKKAKCNQKKKQDPSPLSPLAEEPEAEPETELADREFDHWCLINTEELARFPDIGDVGASFQQIKGRVEGQRIKLQMDAEVGNKFASDAFHPHSLMYKMLVDGDLLRTSYDPSRREKFFNKIMDNGTPKHPFIMSKEEPWIFYEARVLNTSSFNQHKVFPHSKDQTCTECCFP